MHGQLTSVQRDVALVVGRWTYGHEQHRQRPDGALLARSFIATGSHDPTSVRGAAPVDRLIEVAPHGARPARLKLQPDVRLWHGHVVDELLASWTRTVGLRCSKMLSRTPVGHAPGRSPPAGGCGIPTHGGPPAPGAPLPGPRRGAHAPWKRSPSETPKESGIGLSVVVPTTPTNSCAGLSSGVSRAAARKYLRICKVKGREAWARPRCSSCRCLVAHLEAHPLRQ